jgi:hypothetical protein
MATQSTAPITPGSGELVATYDVSIGGSLAKIQMLANTDPSNLLTPNVVSTGAGNAALGLLAPSGRTGDTVFPNAGVIAAGSTAGVQVGNCLTTDRGLSIIVPPGASLGFYVAPTVAASVTAAATVARQYSNPSTSTTPIEIQVNLSGGQQVWATLATAGTVVAGISGLCTYRVI